MPTFTDASLVAAGTGALLWTMLATDAATRRRTIVGLLGFLALEAAVSIRYTNVVILAVALVAVPLTRRAAGLPRRALALWLGSVALLVGLVAAFDVRYYGGALKTGYSSGEITFSASAISPNIRGMPYHLVRSMPFLLLGVAAVAWIAVGAARSLRGSLDPLVRTPWRRDAVVGATLTASWLGIFGLYSAYTWTVNQAAMYDLSVHVIRFYVPALGAVALLAAWFLTRLPRIVTMAGLATVVTLAAFTFPSLAGGGMGGPGGPGVPGGGRFPGEAPPSGQTPGGRFPDGQPPSGRPPSGMKLPGGPAPPGGAPQPGSSS